MILPRQSAHTRPTEKARTQPPSALVMRETLELATVAGKSRRKTMVVPRTHKPHVRRHRTGKTR